MRTKSPQQRSPSTGAAGTRLPDTPAGSGIARSATLAPPTSPRSCGRSHDPAASVRARPARGMETRRLRDSDARPRRRHRTIPRCAGDGADTGPAGGRSLRRASSPGGAPRSAATCSSVERRDPRWSAARPAIDVPRRRSDVARARWSPQLPAGERAGAGHERSADSAGGEPAGRCDGRPAAPRPQPRESRSWRRRPA